MLSVKRCVLAAALSVAFATAALAQAAVPVGVPECDQFLQRYDACLNDNVPESQRAQMRASVDQMRTSWRQMAQNPQGRTMLGPQCTQMGQQMAQSMAPYNCKF